MFQLGTNIDDYVASIRKKATTNVIQPYIILIKGNIKDRLFIQADGYYIQFSDRASPISAFDLLYKLHYVLNDHFATSLTFFYNFIESYLYKTKKNIKNSVRSLETVLKSFNPSATDAVEC